MRLKVLGSGSKGNCYLLQNENETLILECGLPWKTILKGLDFNLEGIVGCLVSHEHKDHSKAAVELMNKGIEVYSNVGTVEALNIGDYAINSYKLDFIESEATFKVGNFKILPFEVQHDAREPLGFLIHHPDMGKLLFITDSYYCRYQFKDINHILIECNYSKEILNQNLQDGLIPLSLRNRLLKSHFSLENVKEFLKASDLSHVEDIVLIHLSESNSDAELFKTEIEKLTGKPTYVADKGLELLLKGR